MSKQSNKYLPYILIAVLVMTLIFAMYYYIVLPKMDERDQLTTQNTTVSTTIDTLKAQINELEAQQNQEVVNEFVLRKKLPASREIDQLLLYLEQLEMIADVRIDSISMNNYDMAVQSSPIVDPNATTETEGASEEEQYIDTQGQSAYPTDPDAETPVSDIAASELPEELKLITLNLAIQAPSNTALKSFIKEIEKLERVMHIDQISYALPGEENAFEEVVSGVVAATIQVTTFYYEGE